MLRLTSFVGARRPSAPPAPINAESKKLGQKDSDQDGDDYERDHRPRSFPPLWRLRDVAARGFCSWDLSHSRHAATAGACALTLSVFASLNSSRRRSGIRTLGVRKRDSPGVCLQTLFSPNVSQDSFGVPAVTTNDR